ncbi:MAG: zinc dependent phospholipase C family protein [Spirosomataceae bacterium]
MLNYKTSTVVKCLVLSLSLLLLGYCQLQAWGFFAHQRINRLAIFTLPPEMMPFYKKHLQYLMENSVRPDMRRYAVKDEAPRHYIDADIYGDSALYKLPLFWKDAVAKYTEDTLMAYGIVPWHIQRMKFQLTDAFRDKDVKRILRLSAEIGHYIGDANVPLHTTSNYNGQQTRQEGIHGFWESRLPELFINEYDFFVGKAEYLEKPHLAAWKAVRQANACLDSVLVFERELTTHFGENRKYVMEERNGVLTKNYSQDFSRAYQTKLHQQVERQMRRAIKMIGDFWYTCWIDAGQPDLSALLYQASDQDKKDDETEEKSWLQKIFNVRKESDN